MGQDGAEHSRDTRVPIDGGFMFQLGGRELVVSALSGDIHHAVLLDGFNQIVLSSMVHDGAEHSGDTRPPTDSGFTFQLGGRELLVSALSDDIRHVVLSNRLN